MTIARPDRRNLLFATASAAAVLSMPVWTTNAHATDRVAIAELARFLEQASVLPPIRCSTRFGDGVPPFAVVEAFISEVRGEARAGADALASFLADAHAEDHRRDRIHIVDGWVLSRTEALAAAAHAFLVGADCRLAGTAG